MYTCYDSLCIQRQVKILVRSTLLFIAMMMMMMMLTYGVMLRLRILTYSTSRNINNHHDVKKKKNG